MKRKLRFRAKEKRYITEPIFIKNEKEIANRMRPQRIFLHSANTGTIVKDGRPVTRRKFKGKYLWVYEPK